MNFRVGPGFFSLFDLRRQERNAAFRAIEHLQVFSRIDLTPAVATENAERDCHIRPIVNLGFGQCGMLSDKIKSQNASSLPVSPVPIRKS